MGVIIYGSQVIAQPYYDTHVVNKYVKENKYIGQLPDTSSPPLFSHIQDKLPVPVWAGHADVISCYWKAWSIAFSNLRKVNPANKFIAPYIDPAFNNCIFMWDSGFMLMFGKYGQRAFNFQATLDNFYNKQHPDGFICREIRQEDGFDTFERFDPSSTGPNILPWSEWEYFLNNKDTLRLAKVFPPLLAYYQWFRTYRSWPDGSYYSSGWGCGMDNQPRLPKGCNRKWSHGHMSWIDATLQGIFAGKILVDMARQLHRLEDVKDIEEDIVKLSAYVNRNMWDPQTKFYYDRYQDGTLNSVKSIGAFWALLAGTLHEKDQSGFIDHLGNPKEFDRKHRVPTLAADHSDYDSDGGYWRGAVWAPVNYMVLRGLTNCKQDSLAHEIALNHLNNVVSVYNTTGTLWENYAPEKAQGNDTKDFVGWTGLVPITVLFEYVFGLRANVPENTLVWDVRLIEEHGVKQYPFGTKGTIDLLCRKRKNPQEAPELSISSPVSFKLILKWEGGSKVIMVKAREGK